MTNRAHISAWIPAQSRETVREYARMTGQKMGDIYSDILAYAIANLDLRECDTRDIDYIMVHYVGQYPRAPFVEANTLGNALCAVFWALMNGARKMAEITAATQQIDRHTRKKALTHLQIAGYVAYDTPLLGARKRGRPAQVYVVMPQWRDVQAIARERYGKEQRDE